MSYNKDAVFSFDEQYITLQFHCSMRKMMHYVSICIISYVIIIIMYMNNNNDNNTFRLLLLLLIPLYMPGKKK